MELNICSVKDIVCKFTLEI